MSGVYNQGKLVVTKGTTHKSVNTVPDWCWVKGKILPRPFPNWVGSWLLKKGATTTVFIDGAAIYTKKGELGPLSDPDHEGKKGGVRSGTFRFEATPRSWSKDLFYEDEPAIRSGDKAWQNHRNSLGQIIWFPGGEHLEVSSLFGRYYLVGDPQNAAGCFIGQQVLSMSCALVSSEGILRQVTGQPRSEGEMESLGIASGAYLPGIGTRSAQTHNILGQVGVGATTTASPSLQDIARAVGEGRGVIVSYDARPVWGSISPTPLGHAVRVTGVEYSQYGEITGFRINDSGNGKANMRVSASKMQAALDGFDGGQLTTTNAPIPKCGVKKPPPGWKPTPPPTPGGGIIT